MSTRLFSAAARMPLWWAACYTAGLPGDVRAARRAEIASDTHEHLHDSVERGGSGYLVRDILQSVLRGAADDLRWRASHVSATGNFVQTLLATTPLGGVLGYVCFHITQAEGASVVAALTAIVITASALLAVSHSENVMFTSSHAFETADRGGDWLTGLSAVLYPVLVLTAMLVIPMASGDPAGDEADIAERAGEGTTRWATGYAIYAAGAVLGLVAMLGISQRVRQAGAATLGLIAALLFVVGSVGVIAVGHGMVGIGLAAVIESGGDGEEYLNANVWPTLLSFIGAALCGLGLWALAAGVWRSRLLDGWSRNACVAALTIQGLMVGLGGGHGVGPVLLLGPISGIIGFGLLIRGVYLQGIGSHPPANKGVPLAPTL